LDTIRGIAMCKKIMFVFLFVFLTSNAFAGDLTPNWASDPLNTLNSGTGAVTAGTTLVQMPTYLGSIDASTYYATAIWVNIYENGDNPGGNAGVSVYAIQGSTGTSTYQIPYFVREIIASEYNWARISGSGNGVTLFIGLFENIPYLGVAAGCNTSTDSWSTAIRYKRMKGAY
jgi:hypothetical protein